MNVFRRFGRGVKEDGLKRMKSNSSVGDGSPPPPPYGGGGGGSGSGVQAGGQTTKTTAQPSDAAQIRNTARSAVQASKAGAGSSTIESTKKNTAVAPESQQQYCDPSAEANIRKAHSPGPSSCEIYLPMDQAQFEGDQFEVCQRFISSILLPLAGVYQVSFGVDLADF